MGNLWFAGYRVSSLTVITQHILAGGVHGQARALTQEGEAGLQPSLLHRKVGEFEKLETSPENVPEGEAEASEIQRLLRKGEEAGGGWRMNRDPRRAVPAGRDVSYGGSSLVLIPVRPSVTSTGARSADPDVMCAMIAGTSSSGPGPRRAVETLGGPCECYANSVSLT